MPEPDSGLESLISGLPYSYDADAKAADIKGGYGAYEGKNVSVAGRATAIRASGKLVFVDLLDESGKIQCYFDHAKVGEAGIKAAKALNPGDIVGIKGTVFKTKPGEISVNVSESVLLAKAIRMLPGKWKGIQDVETRYRKRYLDLIVNNDARDIFTKRVKATSLMRQYLEKQGFLEFETPVIQPLYGGADAEPFKTFVNTLNEEDYLRIANELYLKRLIIGGFGKVYEIYKAFRNEDIDSTHSPEFTMMEAYQAYTDYEGMMKLTEGMLEFIVTSIYKTDTIEYQGERISFKAPFKRLKYIDSINEETGQDVMALKDEELFKLAEQHGIRFEKGKRFRAHAYEKLFDTIVQPKLVQPTFAIDYPAETSPLTRAKRGNPKLVERFELFISKLELANAYSELNNPIVQRRNFEAEERKAEIGDKAAEPFDVDFIEAMEYGMPPTGGIGIGVDRLVMLLTNQTSIKEVIAFPMEKRTQK
jgi:lysyl-tRNA synthetase class 2